MTEDKSNLITLTAEIVAAHVANNNVPVSAIGDTIATVYAALDKLGAPAVVEPEKPTPRVSVRASIKPDYLVSMIDGKQYKMLRRHLNQNGYTPESYREAFGLPADYPMVAANYAEKRRALAVSIGLGRKPRDTTPAAPPAKAVRRPRTPKTAE